MSHNITVEGGSTVRLKTAGKYCDRDIVVTATGGGDENVWVEDDSEIVLEKACYQNSSISAFVTKNGTLTYKRTVDKTQPNVGPKTSYSNRNQLISYYGKNSLKLFTVEQAEVVNDGYTGEYLITKIENGAFSCLQNLKRIKLPDEIIEFGKQVFAYCSSLKKISLPDNTISIGDQAFRETGIEEFYIPQNVESLPTYVFCNCLDLRKIHGIERLTSIGNYCFDGCITLSGTLTLNEKISELGLSTFRACQFDTVKFLGTPTSITNGTFAYCSAVTDIYVPWAEGEVANAPWGATNATIHYNTMYDENHEPIV